MSYYLTFIKGNGNNHNDIYNSTLVSCKNRKEAQIIRSTISNEKPCNIRVLKMNIRTLDNMNDKIENFVHDFKNSCSDSPNNNPNDSLSRGSSKTSSESTDETTDETTDESSCDDLGNKKYLYV